MRPKWLTRTLIPGPHLTLVTTEAGWRQAVKDAKGDPNTKSMLDTSVAVQHEFDPDPETGMPVCVVCIKPKKGRTGIAVAAILAHEAVHVWQAFRKRIGEDHPSTEFEAYAVQFILSALLYEYQRQTESA